MNSYSLHSLDLKMLPYLKDSTSRLFFEAGANDGIRQSNTKMYEEMGWKGILVEPNPFLFDDLKRNRPNSLCYSCALVGEDSISHVEGAWTNSGYAESLQAQTKTRNPVYLDKGETLLEVPARTLASILKEGNIPAEDIDFFSLDVEGYEIDVLNGLNLIVNRPKFMLIECHKDKNGDKKMMEYLSKFDYLHLCELSGNDQLYVRKNLDSKRRP